MNVGKIQLWIIHQGLSTTINFHLLFEFPSGLLRNPLSLSPSLLEPPEPGLGVLQGQDSAGWARGDGGLVGTEKEKVYY